MPIRSFGSARAIALLLTAAMASCEKSGGTPIPSPIGPYIVGLELTGPDTIPPGATAQFTLTARYSDGSGKNVSADSAWQTSNPSVLSIAATGAATGVTVGESSVTAVFDRRRSTKGEVIVVPTGTYRLSGAVRDDGVPVSGARVEVVNGDGRVLSAIADGSYRLYAVSGDVDVRVAKAGYQEQSRRLHVSSHSTIDFDLALSRPRDELAGAYTLTVSAADECRASLPDSVRDRTYTALVTQTGARLQVRLDDATFALSKNGYGNAFGGTVLPGEVTFLLNQFLAAGYFYYNFPYADLLEEVSPSLFLAVDGTVVSTLSAGGLTGTLNGTFQTFTFDPRRAPPPAAKCQSAGHRFVLTRKS
jgi:Carboxypeptidase regulatory-like domain